MMQDQLKVIRYRYKYVRGSIPFRTIVETMWSDGSKTFTETTTIIYENGTEGTRERLLARPPAISESEWDHVWEAEEA